MGSNPTPSVRLALKSVEPPAIYDQRCSLYKSRVVRSQERDCRRDIFRGSDHAAVDFFLAAFDIRVIPEHRCVDRARQHRVHADTSRLSLDCGGASQRNNRGFCRGVRRYLGLGFYRMNAGDIHDAAGGKYEIRVTWGSLQDLLPVTKSNIHAQ